MNLPSADDLFTTQEERDQKNQEYVKNISIYEITDFPNHPFKVKMDDKMLETIESVRDHGVLVPALVREKPTGGYEMISGHRRKMASELAGKETMPCIVRNLSDDEAVVVMVDSNLQRESLLPSERAFAYKMKLDAMKRRAGRPSKENLSQVGTQKRSDELLAEQVGESRNQIQRYIRLTKLVEPLLDMLDEKKIALNSAYKLSFLSKDEQAALIKVIKRTQIMPSLSQTQRLKTFSEDGTLSEAVISAILSKKKADKAEKVTFKTNTLKKYFPDNYTTQDMQETIIALLEKWKEREESHT